MKNYLRASSLLFNQPLLVMPDMLDLGVRWANQVMSLNIVNIGASGAAGLWSDDGMDRIAQREEERRTAIARTGIEVIPVSGVLVSRGSHIGMCETMTSYEQLRGQIRNAVADPMVERIVLDIDSPGGSAVGAFELAADIRAMAQQKPITGIVNFMAYSGGYLLGSACSELVVSQTSGVGSIGVIASHMDRSKMEEGMRMPKGSRERDHRPSASELKAVLKAAGEIHAEMPVIIEVAVETAMRRGELLTLRREHIKGKHALLEDTKNGSRRLVPLSIRARALLESLPARIDGQVFSLAPHSVSQYFLRACRAAKVQDLHFHDLRHEGTSRLFEKGLSIMEAASITGHKTMGMLKRYTHLCPDTLADKLG